MSDQTMTNRKEFFEKIIGAIEKTGIAYMLSGSVGSGFYGQPRATNDIDIVIDPSQKQLSDFIQLLGNDCYINPTAALQALADRSMFNVIDIHSGWKADFIIRKKRTYSQQEFARRKNVIFGQLNVWVLSPEDSILSKLEWSKKIQSQIQYNDAMGIMVVQKDRLDFDYLRKWAKELGLTETLEQLVREIEA
jgi:transcriptional regulator with XRE-family HTH domain